MLLRMVSVRLSRQVFPCGKTQCTPPSMWSPSSSPYGVTGQRLNSTGIQDPNWRRFRLYKRVFAASLFTGTLVLAWYLKKKKGLKLKTLLEDFTRLPLDDSLFGTPVSIYRYQGYIFPGQLVMSGVFKELPDFQFRQDDVLVASYPKAGTTWVQEIVYMLMHGCKMTNENSEVLETRFPYLEYPYPGIKSLAAKKEKRFIKTHLPINLLPPSFESSTAKMIYIARNPRDTAISYFYFMQLLTQCNYQGTLSSFIDLFLSDKTMYSPYFGHVLGYWEARHNPNILFVTYEELQQNPEKIIRKMAEFLGMSLSDAEVTYVAENTSFVRMSSNPSVNYEHWKDFGFAFKDKGKFLRKGKVGDWQRHLNKSQVAAFEEWENEHLKNSDLKFSYICPAQSDAQ
ncbi:Sulfotransferase family cytosolic 1B member 1 [Chionoecetes opilio]|uniref:Sulfotransferase family cytosolic 1B member 1 n=1 Tax=Chionoecetes opilio TaxID=41210 RepID=A0A8J5CH25_CHIOP|nr:Sulfotransferase family cytosolic 1B member 1 [Chionoecetes opilio]